MSASLSNPQLPSVLAAEFPRRFTVLGTRLQPFCIGHAMLLHKVGSPLVVREGFTTEDTEGTEVLPDGPLRAGFADVLLGVLICSRSPARAWGEIESGWYRWRLRWLALKGRWATERAKGAALGTMLDYLREAEAWPMFFAKHRAERPLGTPWLMLLKATLMAQYHRSAEEALATPLAQAHWEYLAHWETQGALEVGTAGDKALIEAAREEAQRLAAEAERKKIHHGGAENTEKARR